FSVRPPRLSRNFDFPNAGDRPWRTEMVRPQASGGIALLLLGAVADPRKAIARILHERQAELAVHVRGEFGEPELAARDARVEDEPYQHASPELDSRTRARAGGSGTRLRRAGSSSLSLAGEIFDGWRRPGGDDARGGGGRAQARAAGGGRAAL